MPGSLGKRNSAVRRFSDERLDREIAFADGFENWKGTEEERAWYHALYDEKNRRMGVDPTALQHELRAMQRAQD